MSSQQQLHYQTPTIQVFDNRAAVVREIQYHCHPETPDQVDQCISLRTFNAQAELEQIIDPRLAQMRQCDATVAANFRYFSSLSGQTLRVDSADAGATIALSDPEGRPSLSSKIRSRMTDEFNAKVPVPALFDFALMSHELSSGEINQEKIGKIESVFKDKTVEPFLTEKYHDEMMDKFDYPGKETLQKKGIRYRLYGVKTSKETLTNKRETILKRIQDTRRMLRAWTT